MNEEELNQLICLLYNDHLSQYGKRKLEAYIKEQYKEIEKKDRQINLMAEFIDRVDIKDEHCKGYICTVATTCYPEEERKEICLNCIKSRFREEAEEDKNDK